MGITKKMRVRMNKRMDTSLRIKMSMSMDMTDYWSVFSLTVPRACHSRKSERVFVASTRRSWVELCLVPISSHTSEGLGRKTRRDFLSCVPNIRSVHVSREKNKLLAVFTYEDEDNIITKVSMGVSISLRMRMRIRK